MSLRDVYTRFFIGNRIRDEKSRSLGKKSEKKNNFRKKNQKLTKNQKVKKSRTQLFE